MRGRKGSVDIFNANFVKIDLKAAKSPGFPT
jgi:hypothetical protein